jgi:hypothetical protein
MTGLIKENARRTKIEKSVVSKIEALRPTNWDPP